MSIGFLNADIIPQSIRHFGNGIDVYIYMSHVNNESVGEWSHSDSPQDIARHETLCRLYDALSQWHDDNRPYRTMSRVDEFNNASYTVTIRSENDLNDVLEALRNHNVNYEGNETVINAVRGLVSQDD